MAETTTAKAITNQTPQPKLGNIGQAIHIGSGNCVTIASNHTGMDPSGGRIVPPSSAIVLPIPRNTVIVPSVMINGTRRSTLINAPLTSPQAAPQSTAL